MKSGAFANEMHRRPKRATIFAKLILSSAVAIAFSGTPALPAQPRQASSPVTDQRAQPTFEVASIKPDQSGTMNRSVQFQGPGRLHIINMPTKDMIQFAYNIKPFQITGGPSWIQSESWDIDAKADDTTTAEIEKLPANQRSDQMRLMLRALLADRFKLVLSHGTKDSPIYALVVAKGGPKLTPTAFKPDSNTPASSLPPESRPHLFIMPGKISAVNQPISGLADLLALEPDLGGRIVQDQTGIKGNYDFEVKFAQQAPFPNMPMPAAPADSSEASLFTALEEQLGLKLNATRGPVETYAIDHIEEPTPN